MPMHAHGHMGWWIMGSPTCRPDTLVRAMEDCVSIRAPGWPWPPKPVVVDGHPHQLEATGGRMNQAPFRSTKLEALSKCHGHEES